MSDETRPWAGVLDIRDLASCEWPAKHLPLLLEPLGLPRGSGSYQGFLPPDRLVVLAPADRPELVQSHLPWLARAATVLLVLDFEGQAPDAGLLELVDALWGELCGALGNVEARLSVNPGPSGVLAVALDRAMELGPAPLRTPPPVPAQREWPAGPWLAAAGDLRPESLAPLLCAPASGPAISAGATLRCLLEPGDSPLEVPSARMAVSSDGRLRLTSSGALLPLDQPIPAGPFSCRPVGFDPVHPVVITGRRMVFTWNFFADGAVSPMCPSVHSWPCGHARKMWDSANNRPVAVAVAPDGSAYVSTFGYDTLISSAVPMCWRHVGELLVADWPPDPKLDPLRALLFCTTESSWGDPMKAWGMEYRGFPPVIVLGPAAGCRYAVDLSWPTYRVRGERCERLEGSGYAVYDAEHALVRRGEGQLLGGWFRWATVLHDGALWRQALGPAEREITYALAMPGTANVVIVAEGALRLV
jgi:hypothetical protein